MAYIRSVVMHFRLHVNTYEAVTNIKRLEGQGFQLSTHSNKGKALYEVRFLVLATGGTSRPRMLNVPGENLPHVSTSMEDPHKYFGRQVLVVGGKNSAVETALRCYSAGARVCLVNRNEQFDSKDIKYWLLPELLGRIERGELQAFTESKIVEIHQDYVVLKKREKIMETAADFVIKAIGFEANMELFQQLGVQLSPENQSVLHDESMQVNIPDVYVLGTAVAGTQQRYRVFIENAHKHVDKIMESISAKLSVPLNWKLAEQPARSRLEE